LRLLGHACLFSILLSSLAIAQSVEGPRGAVNFQNVNVCPARQNSPKPCSRTSKLSFNVLTTTTFGATNVVTQGVPKFDFTLNATTCKGTLAAGSSCYVRVKFAPREPGVRMGAVELLDSSSNLLVSTYIYGNGQAPVAAFNPGTQKNLPVNGFDRGPVAVGAGGDVFFSLGSSIAKFNTRTGVQTTVASGLPYAFGLAVDGAGNVYVAGGSVVKIAVRTGAQTTVGKNLNASSGVAVDGRGNLYVGDDWDTPIHGIFGWPRLAEISAITGEETTLLSGYSGDEGNPIINYPWGVAVDGAGNAYIACFNFGPVFESIANTLPESGGGIIASRQVQSVGYFNHPSAVAVDAAGDVFVVDGGFDPSGIYEVAAGSGVQTMIVNGPWEDPIAVDGIGNIFFPGVTLTELETSLPATLDFGKVAVGSTSAPQSITLQNVGTQPLNAVASGLIIATGFVQVPGPGTDCTSAFSLAPGATCTLTIVFAPQSAGIVRGTAMFTDNALNKAPSVTQSVKLKGIGIE